MQQNYSKAYSDNEMFQIFTGPITNTSITTDFKVWNKPKTASLIYIFALGGGAGGSGGGAQASNTTAGGGGGGGGAGYMHLLAPAFQIPDTLYIKAGYGGKGGTGQVFGGAAGTNGANGGNTFICLLPYSIFETAYMVASPGTAGTAGTSTGGASGNGYTETRRDTTDLCNIGIVTSMGVGVKPTSGVTNYNNTDINFIDQSGLSWMNCIAMGGGGGGGASAGVAYNGSNILLSGIVSSLMGLSSSFIPGGIGGAPGTNGLDGYNYGINLISNFESTIKNHMFFSTGGSGGGGSTSGNGGRGGHGGFGSGGGGGGGTTGGAGSRGGDGGDGGPGVVMIICI